MISNVLIIAKKSLADMGVYVSNPNTFNAPERDVEEVEIAGKNGTLTIDHGRYKNFELEYPALIFQDFKKNIDELRNFLGSLSGYQRVEDSFNPDEFRMGKVKGAFEVKPKTFDDAGTFKIVLDCMPQRFLKSGERFLTVSNGSVLRNPTYQESKPIIRAYGTGTITINGESIKVNSANEYTDIDSEMEDCYKGLTNANGNVTMVTGGFPTLRSGSNTVSFSGFTAVKIKPRWWRL